VIKQEIPTGWGVSPIGERLCKESGIVCRVIITDWIWRHGHANPIYSVIISDCDLAKAKLIRNYYARLNMKGY
jgi:hypothetical protein